MSISDKILEMWKEEQCDDCRNGRSCSANKENAACYTVDEDGNEKYYCFIGCMLLQMDEESRNKVIRSQFDVNGHYEKLRNP